MVKLQKGKNMKKANTTTKFTYGDTRFYWTSGNSFETPEEARTACIESMKEEHSKGFAVTDRAIIRIDHVRIFDEFMVISEQTTKTSIEIINKHYVKEGEANEI